MINGNQLIIYETNFTAHGINDLELSTATTAYYNETAVCQEMYRSRSNKLILLATNTKKKENT
jgi:hypothetical protein